MEKRKILPILILAIFVASALASCAMLNKNLSVDERYLAARTWLNKNVETYLRHYKAADEATKAEWKAKIHPIIFTAYDVLDEWGTHKTDGSKEDRWISVKNDVAALLLQAGILQIKKEE